MFPELNGTQTGDSYPTAAMVQQNTPLLGAQPTEQLRIPQPPMGTMQPFGLQNQTMAQQPIQPGTNPHMDNMVKALQGTM